MGNDFFFFCKILSGQIDSFRANEEFIPLFGFHSIINDSKTEVLTSKLF